MERCLDGGIILPGNGYATVTFNSHFSDWICNDCQARNKWRSNLNKGFIQWLEEEDQDECDAILTCNVCKSSFKVSDPSIRRTNYDRGNQPNRLILFRLLDPLTKVVTEKEIHRILKPFQIPITSIYKHPKKECIIVELESVESATRLYNLLCEQGVYVGDNLLSFTFSKQTISIFDQIRQHEEWFSHYQYMEVDTPTEITMNEKPNISKICSVNFLDRWIYDIESEYYYNYHRKLYFDLESEYIYNPETKDWLYWNSQSRKLQSVEKATERLSEILQTEVEEDHQEGNYFGQWTSNEKTESCRSPESSVLSMWKESHLLDVEEFNRKETEIIENEFRNDEKTFLIIGKTAERNPNFVKQYQALEIEEQEKQREKELDEELRREISEAKARILAALPPSTTIGSDTLKIPTKRIPSFITRLQNAKKIETSNVGAQLLLQLGWEEGTSIGRKKVGILEPIEIDVHLGKSGVGYHSEEDDVENFMMESEIHFVENKELVTTLAQDLELESIYDSTFNTTSDTDTESE